jgi:hypothetical protein
MMLSLKRYAATGALLVSLAAPASGVAQSQDLRNADRRAPAAQKSQDLRNADRRVPANVDPIRVADPVRSQPTGGFDWHDAAVGAGTGIGVLAIFAGLAIALGNRRRQAGASA